MRYPDVVLDVTTWHCCARLPVHVGYLGSKNIQLRNVIMFKKIPGRAIHDGISEFLDDLEYFEQHDQLFSLCDA